MALQDMPLSDLDSASSVGNLDLMYLVQSGESKKVTAQTLIGGKADLSAGKLILSQFPNTSKEVLNDTARFALTTNDVRNGFIVIVDEDSQGNPDEKMYLVTDETNLGNANGYHAFAADAIWRNIQDKPNNLVVYETSGNVSTLKSEGGTALNPKTTTEALVDENGVSCKDRIAYGEESAPVTLEPMSPYLHESDIVNDLATNDPTKPLSAAQGYTLNQNLVKCKTLTTSVGCTYQDTGSIGYRSYAAERVVVTSITGYPTGSTVLAVIPVPATWNNSCIPGFDGTYIGVSAKASGTYSISVVVIYI